MHTQKLKELFILLPSDNLIESHNVDQPTDVRYIYYFFFFSFILKTIFGVIGIQVIIQEDERKDKDAKVIVSNHVSNLDHMIIDFIIANITVSLGLICIFV